LYLDALSSIGKPDNTLTKDEVYAKNQISSIGEYNKITIQSSISEIERNINFPINDSEIARMEGVRLNLSREAEMRTKSFVKAQEQLKLIEANNQQVLMERQSHLTSAKKKIRRFSRI